MNASEMSANNPRQIKTIITKQNSTWHIDVSLLPVTCFSSEVNRKVTQNIAQKYAFQCLAAHIKHSSFSANSKLISQCYKNSKYYAKFIITNVVKNKNSFTKKDSIKNYSGIVESEDNLFSRKKTILDTIDSFFSIVEGKISVLNKKRYLSYKEFDDIMNELEDFYYLNKDKLVNEIKQDYLLLSYEKEEICKYCISKEKKVQQLALITSKKIQNGLLLASKYRDINIDKRFEKYVLTNLNIMELGGAALYKIDEKRYFVFAIGKAKIFENSVSDQVRYKKIALLKAQTNLLKHSGTKITSFSAYNTDSFSEKEIEFIQEKVQGQSRLLPEIGYYYSKDKKEYYKIIGGIYEL